MRQILEALKKIIKPATGIHRDDGLPHPSHLCPEMHAMAIMAKIARQLAIQIGCHLESGDFDENGRNGEKSPEGWRVYGNCLCLSCPSVYLAHEHACFCTM